MVPVAEPKVRLVKFPLVPNEFITKIEVPVAFVNTVVPRFELFENKF